MAAHTSTKKGKRVVITLKDGARFIDKFVEKVSRGVVLQDRGFIPARDLRAMTIFRNQSI